jgi:hypothetical protein
MVMKRLIYNLLGISAKTRTKNYNRARKQGKHFRFESLENRELMTAMPVADLAPLASPPAQYATAAPGAAAAATGTLARHMQANDPQLWLNSWGSFPVPTQNSPFVVQIENEQIKVFSVDTTTQEPIFAVQRGVNGTTPAFHPAGSIVRLLGQDTTTAGTQVVYTKIGGALWQHVGTNKSTGWTKIWDTGVTSFSASKIMPNTVFVNINGALWEHIGTDKNSGWFKIWDKDVKQISAGVQAGSGQASANTVFVLFKSGALYEHVGTNKNSGWFKIREQGVSEISASQRQADTVFVRIGEAVYEHNGRARSTGWTKVWHTGVTKIEASSAQSDTVFMRFEGGALWQHSGRNKDTGWTKIWDSGVSRFSVASTQPNTVFVTINGALWQHTGLDKNSGWSQIWDTNVTQISAATQDDTVFAIINGGLWGHVGKDKNSGWFKIWDSGVTVIGAGL